MSEVPTVNNQRLTQLGIEHGTDKATFHRYTEVYQKYFDRYQFEPTKLLEVGIDKGGSLRMWRSFLGKGSTVIGIDINPSNEPFAIQADVANRSNWPKIHNALLNHIPLDVVIDDGAHYTAAAVLCFENLFPYLKPDGLYIVEDLHAYWDPTINPPGPNFFDYLQRLVHRLNDHGKHQCGDPAIDRSGIAYIHFWKSFVVIKRK